MSQTATSVRLAEFDPDDMTVRNGPPASVPDPGISLSEVYRYHFQELATEHRQRSFGVHVTMAAGVFGDVCDRALHYQLQRANRDEAKSGGYNADKMQRRFALGHAFHDVIYEHLAEGIARHMGHRKDGLVVLGWDVEKSFSLSNGLTGTPDLVVHYRWGNGPPWSIVYDVKSVTPKSLKSYMRGSGIKPPETYARQIQIYIETIPTAIAGRILWIETEFPYLLHDSVVPRSPSVFKRLNSRLEEILDAEDAGRMSLANVGTHCSGCPYEGTCLAERGRR